MAEEDALVVLYRDLSTFFLKFSNEMKMGTAPPELVLSANKPEAALLYTRVQAALGRPLPEEARNTLIQAAAALESITIASPLDWRKVMKQVSDFMAGAGKAIVTGGSLTLAIIAVVIVLILVLAFRK